MNNVEPYSCFHGVLDECVCGTFVCQKIRNGVAFVCCEICGRKVSTPVKGNPLRSIENVCSWNRHVRQRRGILKKAN